uniref:PTS system transporter subunit IIBC n=1 Tax=Clostridioides difficile TaxID=1496 RepID=A0A381IDW2_CLODI|nr:PTS system transporter subunit IIBC [Clostridioides difficile]
MLYQLVLEVQQWPGALSMLFNAALRAPHGGVFVIPVVTHPFAYILAIAVGAWLE